MQTFIEQAPIVIRALNVGFLQTLKLFFITLIGALPLGLVICFGEMNGWAPFAGLGRRIAAKRGETRFSRFCGWFKPVSLLIKLVIWVVRGTPLMLQLLVIYYFPGLVWQNNVWGTGETGRFVASSVAFIFNYACYFSEIYRGGIQGVPVGQQEAGQVLGMTKSQIFFKVTLLQMVKRIVPPMSNEIITLVKDTSLARIIAIMELTKMGESFIKSKGITWPLFYTGVFYLALVGILTLLFNYIERKLSYFK